MNELEEDQIGQQLRFFENLLAYQFFKVHFVQFVTFYIMLWERYMFDTRLSVCNLQVNSSLTLTFVANKDELFTLG